MEQRPNIVWITLDSLRTDHTSVGGYHKATTPHLERIAGTDEGRFFGRCFSHGRYTLVSSVSILTGTYPTVHQVGYERQTVPSSLDTVAERLAAESYQTALLSDNAFVSSGSDLSRGFDRSACLLPSTLLKNAGPLTILKYLLGLRRHSVGFTSDLSRHSRTYLLESIAKDWLSSLADSEPFFLYIHNNETHRPYCPPLPYRETFVDDIAYDGRQAQATATYVHENLMEIIADGCDLSDDQWEGLRAMYDAEIRYTDEWVGDLFDYIREGPFDDTVFVVTADHGEFFGEHGLLAHKFKLDDAVLNVPLVTHGLDVAPEGLVQHTDLVQTLLAQASADTDGVQGVDLRRERREHAIAQDPPNSVEELRAHNPSFDVSRFSTTEKSVIRDARFKLRLDSDTTLLRPPDECKDVSHRYPEVADHLEEHLRTWLRTEGESIAGPAGGEFSDEMRKQLVDLGYLESELPDDE